jgi:hypothetical protein
MEGVENKGLWISYEYSVITINPIPIVVAREITISDTIMNFLLKGSFT